MLKMVTAVHTHSHIGHPNVTTGHPGKNSHLGHPKVWNGHPSTHSDIGHPNVPTGYPRIKSRWHQQAYASELHIKNYITFTLPHYNLLKDQLRPDITTTNTMEKPKLNNTAGINNEDQPKGNVSTEALQETNSGLDLKSSPKKQPIIRVAFPRSVPTIKDIRRRRRK